MQCVKRSFWKTFEVFLKTVGVQLLLVKDYNVHRFEINVWLVIVFEPSHVKFNFVNIDQKPLLIIQNFRIRLRPKLVSSVLQKLRENL